MIQLFSLRNDAYFPLQSHVFVHELIQFIPFLSLFPLNNSTVPHFTTILQIRCVSTTFRDYIDDELTLLRKINVAGSAEDVIENFKVISRLCGKLEDINVARCAWMTDDLLMPLIEKNSKTLVAINLSGCDNVTEKSLQPIIIQSSKKLKRLNLSKCCWLTVGTLEAFVFHHSHVEELDLSGCHMLTERCLNILLQKFRNLRMLCIASVPCVTDNVLFMISKYQSEIAHLNLFNCSAITDRGIGALSLNCNKLEILSVRNCSLVTDRSLNLLRAKNVHIDVARSRSTNPIGELIHRFNDLGPRQMLYLQV